MGGKGLYRRNVSDYINQGIVLYTPPFEWRENIDGPFRAAWKLSKLADISGRFLMSPPDSCGEGSLRAKSLRIRGYALDNGAFTYHRKNQPFNDRAFVRMVRRFGYNADWIVIPDVLFDARSTIDLAKKWIPIIEKACPETPMLFVWQDGMSIRDLAPFVSAGIGIFLGGSAAEKFKILRDVSGFCSRKNVWLHVGRVNSVKRVKACKAHGVCSFDGSGYTRFDRTLETVHRYLMKEQNQIRLFESEGGFCNVKIEEWIR